MFKPTLKPARLSRLPTMAFGDGSGGQWGSILPLAGRPAGTTLFVDSHYPGVLLKKVHTLDQLLHECNGIVYTTVGYNAARFMLVGKTFQAALDNEFPLLEDNYRYFTAGNTSPNAQWNAIKGALHDATVLTEFTNINVFGDMVVPTPKVISDKDQSASGLKDVYGVVSMADDGFGFNGDPYPYGGGPGNHFWMKNDIEFTTIGRYLADNKSRIAAEYDEAAEYVLQAIGEYVVSGEHRNVKLSAPLCTVVQNARTPSFVRKIGIPRLHFCGMTFGYPTKKFPWFAPMTTVIPVDCADGGHLESIVRGHSMALSNSLHGDKSGFAPIIQAGKSLVDALTDCYTILGDIPDIAMSPGAGDQMPKYDGLGVMISVGSAANLAPPIALLSDVIGGAMGPGGYLEMMAAMRHIQASAESKV